MKLWSREATQKEVTITSGLQVSRVAYRAQLGRLGGSRWGWVLQIKFRAIQTTVPLWYKTAPLIALANMTFPIST